MEQFITAALSGHSLINRLRVEGKGGRTVATDPASETELAPSYSQLTVGQVRSARATPNVTRAGNRTVPNQSA